MSIITLSTDMGLRDFYVAAVKGALLRQMEEARIVDISHDIEKFNISQAAYLLRNVYREFPEGTVHIIGVKPELSSHIAHVVVKEKGHYFIAADNGIFSFLFDHELEEVFELNINQDTDDLSFPTKDIFTKAAVHLARGGTPEVIGRRTQIKNNYQRLNPLTDADSIKGHVLHVDSYENLITNISESMFQEIGRGRDFQIRFRREHLKEIHASYNSVKAGEALALFSSAKFLEIALNQGTYNGGGGAASLFGLKVDDMIRIDFE